jgi:hypothetical protein
MQDRVQNYAKVAKDLFSSVAKLAVTQATEQFASHQLVQTSTSPNARASVPLESRVSRFKQQLLASRIDLHELRRLSMQGIPDKDGLRAITWKVGAYLSASLPLLQLSSQRNMEQQQHSRFFIPSVSMHSHPHIQAAPGCCRMLRSSQLQQFPTSSSLPIASRLQLSECSE